MKKSLVCILFCIAGFLALANARFMQNNYKFEAIYIYSFTKYISWPDETIGSQFVIGVIGYSPINQELNTVTNGKQVGNKGILIRGYKSIEEIENCQVLFVASEFEDELPALIKLANSRHILLITEGKDMSQKGAGINLVKVDEKQKFELNEAIVKKAGLKVSNQLIPLAIIVK